MQLEVLFKRGRKKSDLYPPIGVTIKTPDGPVTPRSVIGYEMNADVTCVIMSATNGKGSREKPYRFIPQP